MRFFGFAFGVLAASAMLSGCQTSKASPYWYVNEAARLSSTQKPVVGPPDDRTYVDPDYKQKPLGTVRLGVVDTRATTSGEQTSQFLTRLANEVRKASFTVLAASEKVDKVVGPGADAAFELRIDTFAHIATAGGTVSSDPILNDVRSKVFIVYSLIDTSNDVIAVKYTDVVLSEWEYAPVAMDSLVTDTAATARDLGYVLENM